MLREAGEGLADRILPTAEKVLTGVFPGSESEFVRHPGLAEIPEGKSVCFQPSGEEYHLHGAMVAVAGIAGTEAAQAGVRPPQNVADFTGSDDASLSHQYGDDVEVIVEAVDGLECAEVAGCEPGVFVMGLDLFGNRIEGVSHMQGGVDSLEDAPDMTADMERIKIKQCVAALELREEQFAPLMDLSDCHETCACLRRIKLGGEIIAPVIIVFQIAKHGLQQDGVLEVVKRQVWQNTGCGFHERDCSKKRIRFGHTSREK